MNARFSEKLEATAASRPLVRIVIVGHVDHGKSTLIGRLLHETGSLPDGKLEQLQAVSRRRGMPFEWSFLLDALQTERDQGITIDTSQIRFRTAARDFVLIDAPGHAEFLRNMITGAAQADAAILIVDAAEGIREQTQRHGYLLHLLGIRQVVVVINKMDRVAYDADRFAAIRSDIVEHLDGFGLAPTAVVPIAARHGDGISTLSTNMPWYSGPTALGALDAFAPVGAPHDLPLRMPVQAVYKFDDRRIMAGRIETGSIAVGDEIVVMPGAKSARVRTIESWPASGATRAVHAGQSVGITLDRDIFVARGDLIGPASAPAGAAVSLRVRVFWLHREPLGVGAQVIVRVGTGEAAGVVAAIHNAVDPGEIEHVGQASVAQNHVGEIDITLAKPLSCDPHGVNATTGRVVLEFSGRIAGGGLVLELDPSAPVGMAASTRAPAPTIEDLPAKAERLAIVLRDLSAADRLARLRREVEGRIVFTTSFGIEDQVITHLISRLGLDIDIVTIDTGRLFEQTYAVWAETERRYGRRIRAVYPRHDAVEALVAAQGINGFFETREARHGCCHVRKIEPLGRALAGAKAWITGLRSDQSAHRRGIGLVAADPAHDVIKLNPLFDWTRDRVADFVATEKAPVNALHAQGFVSIGCAPCTRAIAPGEPERAGRWWWENDDIRECGLHQT